jgi:acetate kinase
MAYVLVVNAGSSSLKFALFGQGLELVDRGQDSGGGVAGWLKDKGIGIADIDAVGHRVVHGGTRFIAPARVDDQVQAALLQLTSLAPLHMPTGLRVLQELRSLLPQADHVVCFDTAFHATQPDVARRLPLPRAYHERGLQRYGFHGLSYEHIVDALPRQTGRALPDRLLAAHLGNGASMCAILKGQSLATTMGYSTADGLVMGTRTGTIDPGVVIALLREDGLNAAELEDLLYRRSGLLGISGTSSDLRELLASPKAAAKDAVEYYCYHAARHAGSLAAAMGGIDDVVFTGGVGENSPFIRERIMSHLAWLKIAQVHVVKADEERTIARHVKALLG